MLVLVEVEQLGTRQGREPRRGLWPGRELRADVCRARGQPAAKAGLAIEWQELPIGKRGHELHGDATPLPEGVPAYARTLTALWTALFSLIAGGLCGLLIVLGRGQLLQTLGRYGLMLKARAYFAPAADEVAGKPFPYSVAILLGTLASLYWLQFAQ